VLDYALISIHPDHVENILSGHKTVEIRRTNLHLKPQQLVWIYTTSPVSKIEVAVTVRAVHRCTPLEVWERFGPKICISKKSLLLYAGNRTEISAIEFEEVRRLKVSCSLKELRKINAKFHPPQLAIYMKESNSFNLALSELFGEK